MSTRPVNPKATIVTSEGQSLYRIKDLHINIQWDDQADATKFLFACDLARKIVDTTAEVLPLEEEGKQ